MTKQKLAEVVRLHLLWLQKKPGGVQADLSDESLVGANLSDVNLSRANCRNANFTSANLSGAKLVAANLQAARLVRANLSYAVLERANLSNAHLIRANLQDTDLTRSDLFDTTFNGANLKDAKFLKVKPIPDIRGKVLKRLGRPGCQIFMQEWHTCKTTHCLGGWIVTVHPEGQLLESLYGTSAAASLILAACGETIPDFFDLLAGAEKRAMNWLKTGKQK